MEETEKPVEMEVEVQDAESEDIADSFLCCVCLELLYKPVVLSCGHISCFWCVHKSMSWAHESHCPICRHPYIHFPSICKMLHCLLIKMYPDAYKMREIQILEEEKSTRTFSPQFDALVCHGTEEAKVDGSSQSCTTSTQCGSSLQAVSSRDVAIQEENAPQVKLNENSKQISRSDVLCVSCKQLLFRPIVLNCGHVYCESCLIVPADEKLKCQVCQSLHPGELPNVCLELNHFLEEQFPEEYAMKRCAAQLREKTLHSESSKAYVHGTHKDEDRKSLWSGKVHIGVGCDYCGMVPIIGDRYRCLDCIEKIGFDLCGDCYNSRSKLPGRFNQQHKPEHIFQLMRPNPEHNFMWRLRTSILSFSPDARNETAPNASSPGPIPPTEVPEGSELELSLPFQFEADADEDSSETEAI
ncbi:E3 ubiquitin-protein ligase PRT1 [Punica granatum]|uniref:E3 ubiquitin-protein ligase PRT1 n=1 Tax=Punica granatum TaxID=22663 RepID=A0A6P8BW04_PUNGR|nr:E3 ubiquitin-protein ligase PRT1 [Punica granatum]